MYTLTLSRDRVRRRSLSYFYYIIFEKGFLRGNVTGYRYTYYMRGIYFTFTLYVHTCILRAHIVTRYPCTIYIYICMRSTE